MTEVLKELTGYKKIVIKVSVIVYILISALMAGAYILGARSLLFHGLGFISGFTLAVINVWALGYAGFNYFLKKGSRLLMLWPIATFLLLSLAALGVAFYQKIALGFALGLASPVLFGFAIAFIPEHPLDQKRL